MPDEQQLVCIEWRFDIPIASRECPRPTAPMSPQYVIAISSNNATTSHGSGKLQNVSSEAADVSDGVSVATNSLGAGTIASNSPSTSADNTQWFSCDVESAINITKALEDAINSTWSAGYRRINKLVK
eukprot:GILI01040603.1.p1 GENE.GILI01040603.1~~GILI01040603.1.p1  ORF type:complete len:128 (-),score=20.06 GILI01040603.1:64-447(-)